MATKYPENGPVERNDAPLPPYLSIENGYVACRPRGQFTFDETVDLIDAAVQYCRENDIRGLLTDITSVSGFPPPSTVQRFAFASKWAETARGKVVLSMIAPAEMIDHERIGVTFAVNRELLSDVFTAEPDAIEWLRNTCSPTSPR